MKSTLITKISNYFKQITLYNKKTQNMDIPPNTEAFERCVICGAITDIPVSMPIDLRKNYEIGLGQICNECARKTAKIIERDNLLTQEQIMVAVEQSIKESKKDIMLYNKKPR